MTEKELTPQVQIHDEDVIRWLGQEIYQRNLLEKQLRSEIAKRDQVIIQLQAEIREIKISTKQDVKQKT